ncbi:efflux RND transporter permease subunit [Algicola sagamiensis]|uniref:efflux RND transporter permease subunit n=1 Tax=Algicola sagamiensis TaxID=163869 RepID=UPI000376E0C5|nr:efflux RND transporter permease subunit [Algicola sagamiensis]
MGYFSKVIQHRTILAVITLMFIVLGVTAAFQTPVQMVPDLEEKTIGVDTRWPGATPQDIEKDILAEQERYLKTIPNLLRMVSEASTGSASIELEFPFGTDMTQALIQVSNALSQVSSYPENVDEPKLISHASSNVAFMYFSVVPLPGNPLSLDMNLMRDFVDDYVRPQMERVKGISRIRISGGEEKQIKILIDPHQLVQRGLKVSDVRRVIRQRNRDSSIGDIENGKQRFLIRMVGRFNSISELESLIIKQDNGIITTLKDVATVQLSHSEMQGLSYLNGERNITLAIYREAGSNVIDIKNTLVPLTQSLNQHLLNERGLNIQLVGDDVRYVQTSIQNVWFNLVLGAMLAIGVMYFFIRSKNATLTGIIGIPICTIASFIGLYLFDRTVNVISLAGIAFAIGMTVDNSIVVLESIEQWRKKGLDRLTAAVTGVQDVWRAVFASTTTTILAFLPVIFIQQEAGQLYSDIAITICASIFASMIVALFIVPTLAASVDIVRPERIAKPPWVTKPLGWLFQSTKRQIICVLFSLIMTIGLAFILAPPAEYLPDGEEPKAFTRMVAPPGYNLSQMRAIGDEILPILESHRNPDPTSFDEGKTDIPPLKYVLMRISSGYLWVLSEPYRPQDLTAMMNGLTKLFRHYPGMRAFSFRGSIITSNDGGARAVNIDFSGPDLEKLYEVAESTYQLAEQKYPDGQISSTPSSLSLDQPMLLIHPKWERLAELQIPVNEFGYALSALTDGAYVDEFFLGDKKMDIYLHGDLELARRFHTLEDLPFINDVNQVVPLKAIATIQQSMASGQLTRVDGRKTVSVRVIPPPKVALETAVSKIQSELIPALQKQVKIPASLKIDITGAADQLSTTKQELVGKFTIALVIIFLVMVATFNHWGYPLFVMATVPLGIAGGLIGLVGFNQVGEWLQFTGHVGFHQPFDMITMLGFLILLGTVINNPILIVDQTRMNIKTHNKPLKEAIIHAVNTRLRPILMSTATTLFGLLPLVVMPGEGTELYRGLGVVVLSGLLVSALITLIFLPTILMLALKYWYGAHSIASSQKNEDVLAVQKSVKV